jgi:hypothetical protein
MVNQGDVEHNQVKAQVSFKNKQRWKTQNKKIWNVSSFNTKYKPKFNWKNVQWTTHTQENQEY